MDWGLWDYNRSGRTSNLVLQKKKKNQDRAEFELTNIVDKYMEF